jgi:hypothetical protein
MDVASLQIGKGVVDFCLNSAMGRHQIVLEHEENLYQRSDSGSGLLSQITFSSSIKVFGDLPRHGRHWTSQIQDEAVDQPFAFGSRAQMRLTQTSSQ